MRKSAMRRLVLLPALTALVLAVGACGNSSSDSSSTSTLPTTTATLVTETFTGTISSNGSFTHPFTVKVSGYSMLVGYTSLTPTTLTSLGVGVGYWDASSSTCGLNAVQVDAAKSGSTALNVSVTAGNYCIRAYDGGNIPVGTSVTYTVQVQHY